MDDEKDDARKFRPLVTWWFMSGGRPIYDISEQQASAIAHYYPELLEDPDHEFGSEREAVGRNLESLRDTFDFEVIEGVLARAAQGDVAAIEWLEVRGFMRTGWVPVGLGEG